MNNKFPGCKHFSGRLFFTIIGAFCFLTLPAQEYNYVNYNTRDGLAGSTVYNMAQDKDGFMWFATETGLSRYDGRNFKNFTTADGLPDNEIIKLFVDSKNRVWIIPFKISLCYYYHGKIYTAANDSLLNKLNLQNEVVSITENKYGDLVILEKEKLTLIKNNGEIIVVDHYRNGPFYGAFAAGVPDSVTFQFAMCLTGNEYSVFNLEGDSLVMLKMLKSEFVAGSAVTLISPGLLVMNKNVTVDLYFHDSTKNFSLPSPEGLISINRLNDSIIVLNTSSYVMSYNFKKQQEEQFFFRNKKISCVLEDREGGIWFSSLGEGVFRLITVAIKNYVFSNGNTRMPVYSIKKYGDTLFAGTDNFCLWNVDSKNHLISKLKIEEKYSIGRINTIDKGQSGELYVGTDLGLFKIRGKKITPLLVYVAVKAVYIENDTIIVGVNHGLFTISQKEVTDKTLIRWGRTTAVFKLKEWIYFGTLNGLYRVDEKRTTQFLGNLHPALKNRISSMQAVKIDSTLWIATYGDGIIGIKNGKVVHHITVANGLTSNICRTIHTNGNNIWVGTEKGLNKIVFNGSAASVTRYTMADGFTSNIINDIVTDNNIVYVATPAGINYFDESELTDNSFCTIHFTGIQTPRRRWYYDTTHLQLVHEENNIRFDYAGISFRSGGDVSYRYRLIGLDDDWQTTRDNFLTYPTLPSGDYELQIKAVNKFGVESETAAVSFSIEKLLWEKTWFRIAFIVLIGILIWTFIHYRIRLIRQQEALKSDTAKRIAELEQMALKAQMNPHFIFNSLNSIQHYIIDKDIRGANKFITDFSRLVRYTLDLSSRNSISLEEEINYISTYLSLEQAKFENKFSYSIHTGKGLDVIAQHIPPMILQPYIENSIRHGIRYRSDNKGRITVNFTTNGHYMLCSIEDNGVGRTVSAFHKGKTIIEYQSKGMTLTAKRIDMMNKNNKQPIIIEVEDLYNKEGMSQGTKVILKFPVKPFE